MSDSVRQVKVAIIGAGFGGVGMGITLKKQGFDGFTIFEGGPEVGGSWRTNTYPGCACDVPSHLYSYSFELNPNWSQAFSPQEEIWEYIGNCAQKYGVMPYIEFEQRVTATRFNSEKGVWELTLNDNERVDARVLIQATGALSLAKYPDIEGRDTYKGVQAHVAHWDNNINLKGKRVAVIGTGASAIQVVPTVAPEVEELFVYQRSASWVLPKKNVRFKKSTQALWKKFPLLQKFHRLSLYWMMEMAVPALLWFPSLLKYGRDEHKALLNESVSDPELRKKLTPDYELGCKRTLMSDDYFSAFERDNVELITESLESITPKGIITADGIEREVDVIIYTTGYETGKPAFPFDITNERGETLQDYWGGQPKAYYGMNVTGFPNLGLIMGPNAGPGHTSVLVYQEAQYKYLTKYIRHILNNNVRALDVKESKLNEMFQWAQDRMKNSTWLSGCASWYLNEDGTNSTMWPGFSFEYLIKTRRLHLDAYNQSPLDDAC
ncbi:NAD(P)/FAD-dependent oxidoreductase [Maricurvus nonylphenolicus]|uniref:flavin-containing monooxygenase n=1 Tax=Maricurvus nonylphenolicus TaxID=1008307 RepID=UPI0036F1BF31